MQAPETPDLDLLLDAARDAGTIALRHFRADPEVWEKSGGQGPVTEADLEVDRMLRHELRAARPDWGWLSEETEDDRARLQHDTVFIVDPIDGTRAFIDGRAEFAHSLAIAKNGQVTHAVVHLPALDLTYTAHLGGGAALNGTQLRVATPEGLEGARVLAPRLALKPDHWKGTVPNFSAHFQSSLAYRLCLVAAGDYDGMLTMRPAWEWDIAAGDLIVQEAGGRVSDAQFAPTSYNTPDSRLPGMIAAPEPVHAGFRSSLRALRMP